MHIHILGICGTFMGGLALLAKHAGHVVTGCDASVYPPMSTQLERSGIALIEGWDEAQLTTEADLYIVGNVVSRGNPLMEAILNRNLPYTSGPQWLAENILRDKWVLAVAGTHGKTTTASMLTKILDSANLNPSYLIGGVPLDFDSSARGTNSNFFVIEADEYDTAFFDKRSKFVHYRPRTLVLNNLEFDHADIFPDLAAIENQFHHLVRTVPANGQIIVNAESEALDRVVKRGCWTESVFFGGSSDWAHTIEKGSNDLVFLNRGESVGGFSPQFFGEHNHSNALAATLAARHAGVPVPEAIAALKQFSGVKRRMELRGTVRDIAVYDDFAHHPTAIRSTVSGLRGQRRSNGRLLAVFEPRSNTMKMGASQRELPASFEGADKIFCYVKGIQWDVPNAFSPLKEKIFFFEDINELSAQVVAEARPGDDILIMSNGGFEGVHTKILDSLRAGK
jgi:UDP-N-acetylmuramate: L-alanyl-gamma-D-glutamyl-meso-diaminopimelate ligase